MLRSLALVCLFFMAHAAFGGSIVGSRHDLSTGSTPYVCEFCHIPHTGNPTKTMLWNRGDTTATFTLYGSPTMNTSPSQPGGVSRLCMSCHDGVLSYTVPGVGGNQDNKHALYASPVRDPVYGSQPDMTSQPNCERCHADLYGGRRKLVLGTNLGNDHPISMPFPTPAQDAFFNRPPDATNGWGGRSQNDVKLYGGWVECASCHNVHDPGPGAFLRKSNAGSRLCLTCHTK